MRVLVAGSCIVDVKATALQEPERGSSNPARVRIAAGGVGRNIAENLRRLGAEVVLTSVAGNDPFAAFLEAELEALGIEFHIARKGATAFDVGWFEASGEMELGLCDIGALEEVAPDTLLAPVGPLETYDAAVLEANLPAAVIDSLASEMRVASVPYALETVSVSKAGRLGAAVDGAFLLKPNRAEAETLTGIAAQTPVGARAAAQALRERGARHVVVSMGPDGFWLASGGVDAHVEAVPTHVVDVTGAGDALLSAGLVGLIDNLPQVALERGMQRAASLACETPGAVASALSPAVFEEGDEWRRRP